MNRLAQINLGEQFLGKNHFLAGDDLQGVGKLTSIIISNALVIAGIIVVFLFIAGGFGMIAGAGNNNPEKAQKSQKTLTAAIIGFVIIFAAYWIVQIIGKITGVTLLGF